MIVINLNPRVLPYQTIQIVNDFIKSRLSEPAQAIVTASTTSYDVMLSQLKLREDAPKHICLGSLYSESLVEDTHDEISIIFSGCLTLLTKDDSKHLNRIEHLMAEFIQSRYMIDKDEILIVSDCDDR